MTIVCTGSIAFDYLMTFPGYFRDHILPERIESLSLSFWLILWSVKKVERLRI